MDFLTHSGELWRNKTTLSQSQKETLQEWFEHNPYPDADTQERLAQNIGISKFRLKNWFQNSRSKLRKLDSKCSVGKEQHQGQQGTQDKLPTKARQPWALLTKVQSEILSQMFEKNRFPDAVVRKKLAERTGIEESKIQQWFQKQRSLYAEHGAEPTDISEDGASGSSPSPATQQQPGSLPNLQVLSFPASCCTQTPSESLGAFGSHEPSIETVQPTDTVQGGGNPDPPPQPTSADDCSDPLAPLWSTPGIEHEPQLEGPAYPDVSYIMQWWDKDRLALIAEWEPLPGTLAETDACPQQAWSTGELSHLSPPDQQNMENPSL